VQWVTAAREEVRDRIAAIEQEVDQGRYRPGPWEATMGLARRLPRADRAALADEISRVSAKLHARKGIRKVPLGAGLAAEIAGAVAGVILLVFAIGYGSSWAAILAAIVWMVTLEPLVKITAGYLLGIDYEYVYLFGVEPRFKMRYGDYMAAPRWARVVLHLAGTVGAPLGAWLPSVCVGSELWRAADLCWVIFWILVAVNVASFCAALFGVRRVGPLRLALSSGGAAAFEFKEAMEI
jgi:hypothetical protein